jgi:hypothetical protein
MIRCARAARFALAGGLLFGASNCLPNNYWSNLAGSSLSSVVGVLIDDALSVLLPATS